jgi:3-(3-hydroxy-phenyl)propionate hydroxylase
MSLLTIETPDGPYRLHAQYVVACDGARSSLRQMVGAEFAGQVFEDQFLIADVKMTAEFPTERWFWFDPPFHAGRSRCCTSSRTTSGGSICSSSAMPTRGRKAAGKCAAADRAHARPRQVRFRMDLAVQIPVPADGQIHPWPRDLCRRCRASGLAVRRPRRQFRAGGRREPGVEARPRAAGNVAGALLESYHTERSAAADENIRESTRSTDFMAPARARRRGCARRCCRSPRKPNSASAWSMAGGSRCRRSMTRRSRPPMAIVARRPAARRVDAGCADCRRGGEFRCS